MVLWTKGWPLPNGRSYTQVAVRRVGAMLFCCQMGACGLDGSLGFHGWKKLF
jgi:hypothetical protein